MRRDVGRLAAAAHEAWLGEVEHGERIGQQLAGDRQIDGARVGAGAGFHEHILRHPRIGELLELPDRTVAALGDRRANRRSEIELTARGEDGVPDRLGVEPPLAHAPDERVLRIGGEVLLVERRGELVGAAEHDLANQASSPTSRPRGTSRPACRAAPGCTAGCPSCRNCQACVTRPCPNSHCQTRFTITRAVSGLLSASIHSASSRRPLLPAGIFGAGCVREHGQEAARNLLARFVHVAALEHWRLVDDPKLGRPGKAAIAFEEAGGDRLIRRAVLVARVSRAARVRLSSRRAG